MAGTRLVSSQGGRSPLDPIEVPSTTKRVLKRYKRRRHDRLIAPLCTRIDAEEFYRMLDAGGVDDAKVFNDKLREWEDFYNYHRPHGGLGGHTPYERLRQKTTQV